MMRGRAVTLDAKRPGDLVYILGETYDELGGSEWYAMHGAIGNQVPKVNAEKAKALYNALSRAISAGLVASCHDCSDGGAGIAIAETAFAGGLGMLINLALFPSSGIRPQRYAPLLGITKQICCHDLPRGKEIFRSDDEGNRHGPGGRSACGRSY